MMNFEVFLSQGYLPHNDSYEILLLEMNKALNTYLDLLIKTSFNMYFR